MRKLSVLALVLPVLASSSGSAQALLQEDLALVVRGPRAATRQTNVAARPPRRGNELVTAAMGLIRLYQKTISSQDGQVCNFTVSCSRFAIRAVERHGLVHGLAIASDRMQRCNGSGADRYVRDPDNGLLIDLPLDSYLLGRRGTTPH